MFSTDLFCGVPQAQENNEHAGNNSNDGTKFYPAPYVRADAPPVYISRAATPCSAEAVATPVSSVTRKHFNMGNFADQDYIIAEPVDDLSSPILVDGFVAVAEPLAQNEEDHGSSKRKPSKSKSKRNKVDKEHKGIKFPLCNITQDAMQEPTKCLVDDVTYERVVIERWVQERGTSPATGAHVELDDLVPDDKAVRRTKEALNVLARLQAERFHVIPYHEFKSFKMISSGQVKDVWKVCWQKRLAMVNVIRNGMVELEVQKFVSLNRSKHVLRFFGESIDPHGRRCLVTETPVMGTLSDTLEKLDASGQHLSLSAQLEIWSQVCQGMKVVAEQGVVHYDLAARNVFVFSLDNDDVTRIKVKIGGFGIRWDTTLLSNQAPTRWMPPETIERNRWSEKSDIFACGVVAWEILTHGKIPWTVSMPNAVIGTKILQGERLKRPKGCPDNVWKIIKKCWVDKPDKRPSFKDLHKAISSLRKKMPSAPAASFEPSAPPTPSMDLPVETFTTESSSEKERHAQSHLEMKANRSRMSPTREIVLDMNIDDLRILITNAGLPHDDCIEKTDLIARALQAQEVLGDITSDYRMTQYSAQKSSPEKVESSHTRQISLEREALKAFKEAKKRYEVIDYEVRTGNSSWAALPPYLQEEMNHVVRLYVKAARDGNAYAQNNLGMLFANGRGVQPDQQLALEMFEKSAQQGNMFAASNLGLTYAQGRGVPRDDAIAASWFLKAAVKGDTGAQNNLGVMYKEGRGLPLDPQQAIFWFTKAAETGDIRAAKNLNVMLESRPQDRTTEGGVLDETQPKKLPKQCCVIT